MDEGKGRIYLDPESASVVLNYSSIFHNYEIPDIELDKVLRKLDGAELTIESLEAPEGTKTKPTTLFFPLKT